MLAGVHLKQLIDLRLLKGVRAGEADATSDITKNRRALRKLLSIYFENRQMAVRVFYKTKTDAM